MSFEASDEDDDGCNVEASTYFEKCTLNEAFQNIVENPYIYLRGEANKYVVLSCIYTHPTMI
jgi:hypothetical protein